MPRLSRLSRLSVAGLVGNGAPAAAASGASCGSGVAIQIHSLTNVPDMDLGALRPGRDGGDVSDVYLTLQIFADGGGGDGDGQRPFGPKQKSTTFDDARDVVFGECYFTFRTPADLEGAVLRVKVYDRDDFSKDDKIAHLDLDLAELERSRAKSDGASTATFRNPYTSRDVVFQTRRMEMDTKRRGEKSDEPVSINLRLLSGGELARRSTTKRFFLIRHGESLWNEAQDENNVMGLLKFDHALNRVGIDQCKALNAAWREADFQSLAPSEKEFVRCPAILCSPLTRCVQTALLSLHAHPTLREGGVTLQRNLREVKSTLGSLDTLGVEVGAEDIKRRARDSLAKACGTTGRRGKKKCDDAAPPPLTDEEVAARVDPIELRTNDVASKWWTPKNKHDDEKVLGRRMDALMGTLRYLPSDSAILVGHSLIFRHVMRTYLPDDFDAAEGGETREELMARKMGNAAVAAVDVRFPAFPEEDNRFEIVRVEFLFGSGLAEE